MLARLFALLLLAPCGVAQDARPPGPDERPRNLVVLIADGIGPAAVTLGREVAGRPLALDAILRGAVRTVSASHRIADSASGAVALASGIRTTNRTVGVDTLGQPVGTILEAAEAQGLATGVVTTSRITDATPAAFTAHHESRYAEDDIALQQIGQGIEVILGGGRRHFVPQGEGEREDGRDLLAEAADLGYTVVATDSALATAPAPVLGFFAHDVMAKEIDRAAAAGQPSLAAMTARALDLLADDEDGFVLIVETEGTDEAAHANDPAALAYEVIAFDEAVAVALDFAVDGNTLVVALSDHETGGLGLGRERGYYWYPEYLRRVSASAERMLYLVGEGQPVEAVLRDYAAIDTLTAEEQALLAAEQGEGSVRRRTFARIMSQRARVGWTTGSHTAIDIGLYAFGPGAERFSGVLENDAVGRLLADLLGLDLAAVTERLRAAPPPAPDEEAGG